MTVVAAYNVVIKKGGTPTAMTSESMTGSGAGPYQIDAAAKRVWDRDTVPTFYEDSVAIATSDVLSIDYTTGKVTFATSKTGSIYVDGKYLPMTTLAGLNSYTVNMAGEILDDTTFDSAQSSGGYHSRIYGLRDVSLTLGGFYQTTSEILLDAVDDKEVLFVELQPQGSGKKLRGWFVVESDGLGGDVTGLETQDASLSLDGAVEGAFSFAA